MRDLDWGSRPEGNAGLGRSGLAGLGGRRGFRRGEAKRGGTWEGGGMSYGEGGD